jgi:hypothetical protein
MREASRQDAINAWEEYQATGLRATPPARKARGSTAVGYSPD